MPWPLTSLLWWCHEKRRQPHRLSLRFESENGVDASYRLAIYKNRLYFTSDQLDTSAYSGLGQTGGIPLMPLSQDMKYDQWLDRLVTVYAHQSIIKMGVSGWPNHRRALRRISAGDGHLLPAYSLSG